MSSIRVLVGTHKGAFILSSDGMRKDWRIDGPFFGGWDIYHVKASPVDPNRIYASQTSGWFGQVVQRSNDGGTTWEQVGADFAYDGVPGTHQWYDGTPHPWEFARVWHLEPALDDADTVYAGVEDAALFRSTDGGASWSELSGLRDHETGPHWQPGAGGMCLHTIVLDPSNKHRMYAAISAAGAFRSDDGGAHWKPINRGLRSAQIPDPDAPVGHCVHRITMHPARPNVLFMQKHWDVMRSDDAGDNGMKSAAISQPISASRSKSTPTSPIRSTSSRSPAIRCIIRPTGSCVSTAAAAAGMSGSRSRTGFHKSIAMSTFCVMHRRSIASTRAASTSERRADKCTFPPTAAIVGKRLPRTCRRYYRSKFKRSRDQGRAAGAPAHARASQRQRSRYRGRR
jgi:hypothetical protein